MTGRAGKFAADDVVILTNAGTKLAADFDEQKHPRADDGRFGEVPGEQPNEETPSDQDGDGIPDAEEQATATQKLKSAISAIVKIVNTGPAITEAIVKETGAPKIVAKAAMVLATVGDWMTPGAPVGSMVVSGLAQVIGIRKVNAFKVAKSEIRDTLATIRGKSGKPGTEGTKGAEGDAGK